MKSVIYTQPFVKFYSLLIFLKGSFFSLRYGQLCGKKPLLVIVHTVYQPCPFQNITGEQKKLLSCFSSPLPSSAVLKSLTNPPVLLYTVLYTMDERFKIILECKKEFLYLNTQVVGKPAKAKLIYVSYQHTKKNTTTG